VVSEREQARCRERLERLSESTLDRESIQREAIVELQRVIGFDRWCWPLADPDTLLPLSGLAEHDYGPGFRVPLSSSTPAGTSRRSTSLLAVRTPSGA
jgi:hypothetical protein